LFELDPIVYTKRNTRIMRKLMFRSTVKTIRAYVTGYVTCIHNSAMKFEGAEVLKD